MQDYLSIIKFNPGSKIADLVLNSKIHSTTLYETWSVYKQEAFSKKPYLAHIFKYSLGSQFPLKPDDLNNFCHKITEFNKKMVDSNIRTIPCYNSTSYNQRVPGGVLSYLLFEKPTLGDSLSSLCNKKLPNLRICKYMLKDLAKGLVKAMVNSKSSDALDVTVLTAQNGFFYGKLPKVVKAKTDDVNNTLNVNAKVKETTIQDNSKHFITIAYPKAFSPESIKEKSTDASIEEVKNKQSMVLLGKFLLNIYKGLDNSTNMPVPSPDDDFNPSEFIFKNLTDVYLDANKEKELSKQKEDEYYGVKSAYLTALDEFVKKTLTTQKAFKEMDDMLKDSYYEFIFKLVNFDKNSKTQFDKFESVLNHPFITKNIEVNKVKSDTDK